MLNSEKIYVCEFCKAKYKRERTLINHLCEKKRRYMSRNETHSRIAFHAWVRWHEMTNTRIKKNTNLFVEFMNSNLYLAFAKFGRHVIATNIINTEGFIDFVIKNSIKLDDWCKNSVYEAYVRYNCRKEDIYTVLERQVKLMDEWSNETDNNWADFFQEINTNVALNMIRNGKLSPWILLNAVNKDALLNRMSDEQILLIDEYIDYQWWIYHMARNKKETRILTDLLKEYNI